MTDNFQDSELLALRNEALKGLNKKSIDANDKDITNLSEDDELVKLRQQALKAKRVVSKELQNNNASNSKKNQLPGRFRYDRESEEEEDDDLDLNLKSDKDQSDQENENESNKKDEFVDKYQKYRDRCTRIMSNVEYEPDMLSVNLKETLNNLDLRRLLDNNESKRDPKKTDLILEKLDYAYAPITQPICIKKNEIYINANFRPKIDYQRSYSKDGETKYWKNDNHCTKSSRDGEKSSDENINDNFDDDDEFQSNKKLKSIVVQQVIKSSKRDDMRRSSNQYSSSYKRRRRYDSSSSR